MSLHDESELIASKLEAWVDGFRPGRHPLNNLLHRASELIRLQTLMLDALVPNKKLLEKTFQEESVFLKPLS